MAYDPSTAGNIKRTKRYKDIRANLMSQIERDGPVGNYAYDLVEDYMNMWVTKELLAHDIVSRGPVIVSVNGRGETVEKKNDSIDQQLKVNGQMLRLLGVLGIKPSQLPEGGGDRL